LENYFSDNFNRFLKGPLDDDYEAYQILFSCMIVAREPLDMETVRILTNINKSKLGFRRAKQPLVVEGDSVRFLHKLMLDFLEDEAEREPLGK